MDLFSQKLEEVAPNTRPKIEDILVVMDKSTHEEHLNHYRLMLSNLN